MRTTRHPAALQDPVALAVALEGDRGAVGVAAVELHRDPCVSPYGVDLEALHQQVDLGLRQVGAVDDGQEHDLELAPGHGRAGSPGAQEGPHGLVAGPPRIAVKQAIERELVPEAQHLGLVEGPLELAMRQDGREVVEGARNGGDGDGVPDRDFVGGEGRAVELDARTMGAPVPHGDVDAALLATQAPQRRRRAVTECSVPSRAKDGGHPARFSPKRPMSHGVHPAVKSAKPTDLQPMVDRIGQPPNRAVDPTGAKFSAYIPVNLARVGHAAQGGGLGRTCGLRVLRLRWRCVPRSASGRSG